MNAIEINNASYTYSPDTPFKKLALDDVSLTVRANAITGLMGHTGSGKSTLVQLINGLIKPDTGSIKVFGKDIWENPKDIHNLRFKVGLVFQYPEYQLFEETVRRVHVWGRLRSSRFEGQDGTEKQVYELLATRLRVLKEDEE